ncbi:DNA internalization-related competence protein ComEC/Rec2 [Pseudalkalibacillus caeni]|uniref:DNA internalization-related competence protein ComEC/Rec2 n=1 Tax=Exobacillus caeni TaxID=2574798 RepID=A0A5R9FAT7_9BACL|nr:DNA internalization-related competence protein ComEC/Rec2 [Pseudalkalibacillus caeni]TLS39340.1 DNA internalization-related competence protein ComEC/Rec2 [Pseudalkalibacillus caeni]
MTDALNRSAVLAVLGIAAHKSVIFTFILMVIVLYLVLKKVKFSRVACLVLVYLFFYTYFALIDQANHSIVLSGEKAFSGKIRTIPEIDGDRLSFVFQTSKEKMAFSYRIPDIISKEQLEDLKPGMVCRFQGTLQTPSEKSVPNLFDYREYLRDRKIHWILTPDSFSFRSCKNSSYTLVDRIQQYRQMLIQKTSQVFPAELNGLAAALLLGERQQIGQRILNAYQSLGLTHLLAVSGLHVGIIVALIFYLFIRAGLTRERSYEVLLFMLPVYAILTGAAPSVIRAVCMAMIVIGTLRFKLRLQPGTAISAALLGMIVYNPYFVFQPGFQLSYIVSFGLVLSAPAVMNKLNHPLFRLLAMSTVAQLLSLPVVLFHFYELSLLSLPLNLLFVPFISVVVLPLFLLVFVLSFLSVDVSMLLARLATPPVSLAHQLFEILDQHNAGQIVFGRPGMLMILLMYAATLFLFIRLEGIVTKRKISLAVGILLFVYIIQWCLPYLNPLGKVTFLDVGQGDSTLIELPFNRGTYLIDTGGTLTFNKEPWKRKKDPFEVGKDITVPFLKSKGIKKLDYLILTHGDLDHIGGADAVLSEMKIKHLLYGKGPLEGELEKSLLKKAAKKDVPVSFVQAGNGWKTQGESFAVLSPIGNEQEKNNRSIVLLAEMGGLSWLFTGDLELAGEISLLERFPNIKINVLKAGHHGSNSSTSPLFVKSLAPDIAVISVGAKNRFGHPNPQVLDTLKKNRVTVFRTDKDGTIQYRFFREHGQFSNIKR